MNGQYRRIHSPASGDSTRPAFFLDRDGVLVKETGYLHRPEDLSIIPGAAEALRVLNKAGIPAIIVTNQAGIGHGYYLWSDFELLQETLAARLLEQGARFNAVWACATHPDGNGIYRLADDPWRKPNPGMLLDAARQLNIDLTRSWMAGDKLSDIEAGLNAGVQTVFHVQTGYGRETRPEVKKTFGNDPRVVCCEDVREAVSLSVRVT